MKARHYLLSTVSALALAGTAFAADMPVKAPPPVAVVAPSWTGFYLGAHGGIAWLRHEQTVTEVGGSGIITCVANIAGSTCDLDTTGAVAGGQIGYNLQQGQWVVGLEADASWTSLKKTVTFTGAGFPHIINDKIDWLSSVRGRLGWTTGNMLFYGTGGVAVASFDAGWLRPTGAARAQFDKTTVGWVAGGGIEMLFGQHWSGRAEYLYYGLGKKSLGSTIGGTYSTAFRNDVSVVRLGINYRP